MLPCSNSNFPAMKSAVALNSAIAFAFQAGESVGIDLAFFDDLGDEIAFVGQAVGGSEGWKVGDFAAA